MPTTAELPSTRMYSWSLVKRVVIESSGGFTEITMGDEGQRRDHRRLRAAAYRDGEPGARSRERRGHEAEGNGAVEGRREAAARHLADGLVPRAENLGPVAGRGALDQQADAAARKVAGVLLQDAGRPRKIGGLAAALAHGETEPGLGGRDG